MSTRFQIAAIVFLIVQSVAFGALLLVALQSGLLDRTMRLLPWMTVLSAFVSGPIARRLTNGTGVALVPAALVGAAVVISGDFAGQHLLPVQLPVGILTAAVGAPYLLYLLVRSNRIGHGG